MKWQPICLGLILSLLAVPVLALEAVPFAGFAGLVLGSPVADVADVPARSYVALFALAEYGGLTRVGALCEFEEPGGQASTQAANSSFIVLVTLVRADGSTERIARFKMRLRDGLGEAARLRELNVGPGDYLVFQFRLKGEIQVAVGQQFVFTAYAGAPDAT